MADAPDLTLFQSENLESRVKALENKSILANSMRVTFDTTVNYKIGARITIDKAGIYIVTGSGQLSYSMPAGSSEQCIMSITVNNSGVATVRSMAYNGGGDCMSYIGRFSVGDVVAIRIYDYGTHSGAYGQTNIQVVKIN